MVEVMLCKSAHETAESIKLLKALGMKPQLVTKVRQGWAIDYYADSLTSKAGLSMLHGKGPQKDTPEDFLTRLRMIRATLKSRFYENPHGQATDLMSIVEELINIYEATAETLGANIFPGATNITRVPRKASSRVEN